MMLENKIVSEPMKEQSRSLLVCDSGIGGLSIASAIRRFLPDLPQTYLADYAGFPYGALSSDTLIARLLRLLPPVLAEIRPLAMVIACNTASTVVLPELRARFDLPIIGCVPPIKPAVAQSRTGCIGLLATPATVRSAYVQDMIARFAADCTILYHGSPTLATLAEAMFRGEPPDPVLLREALFALINQPGGDTIDTVALGCTHYAFLLPLLRPLAPQVLHWLDSAEPVARQVSAVLAELPSGSVTGYETNGLALVTAPLPEGAAAGLARYGFPRWRII
jgi:glutamate racemase